MDMFQTEFPFELPKGYLDASGILHKTGTMRLATAADEIVPLKDPRVQQNPSYLTIILLARVITRLGSLPAIDYPIDKLYEEMAFLGYYLHWSRRELLQLPHMERIRWCKEVSEINQRLNGEERKKNIFDV